MNKSVLPARVRCGMLFCLLASGLTLTVIIRQDLRPVERPGPLTQAVTRSPGAEHLAGAAVSVTCAASSGEPLKKPETPAQPDHGALISVDEQDSLDSAIAKALYSIREVTPEELASPENDGARYFSNNPAQGISARFLADRTIIESVGAGQPWSGSLALAAVTRGTARHNMGAPLVAAEGQLLSRDLGRGVVEHYENRKDGLEHSFVISQRPAGDAGASLSLVIKIGGGLSAQAAAGAGEAGLQFTTAAGAVVLNYTKLKVWDAAGSILPARMHAEPDGGEIAITVADAGAVYPLTIDPLIGVPEQTLSTTSTYGFGLAVAIDGDTAVVGSWRETAASRSGAGAAYVFVRNALRTWYLQARLTAPDAASGDGFGSAVAVQGNRALIGVFNDDLSGSRSDAGSAWFFVRNEGVWTPGSQLTASDGKSLDYFGQSVALDGDTAVVGVHRLTGGSFYSRAYVYAAQGGTWSEQAVVDGGKVVGATLHRSAPVAVSGNTLVLGSNLDSTYATDRGVASIYVKNGSSWALQVHLVNQTFYSYFGGHVAIDGDTVVVSCDATTSSQSSGSGPAFVFVRTGSTWTQQATLGYSGRAVAVAGNKAFVAGDAGIEAYRRTGTTWALQSEITASDAGSFFGGCMAFSGNTLLVGYGAFIPPEKAHVFRILPGPVLLIPGIAGSMLIGADETGKHGNEHYLWPSIDPDDIPVLNLMTGAADVKAVNVVGSYAGTNFYAGIIGHLKDLGYTQFDMDEMPERMTSDYMLTSNATPKPTLFPFPYDWRRGNSSHIATLRQYVTRIRQLHGNARINVVAHSMGGLLLRRYVLAYGSADFENVATVGTPFWGAPMAIYRMLTGEFYELPIDLLTNDDMRAALATFPGVHELLPSDTYLANGGWPVMKEDRWDINHDRIDNNGTTWPAYSNIKYKELIDAQTLLATAPLLSTQVPSLNNDTFHNRSASVSGIGTQDNWAADQGTTRYLHFCGVQEDGETTTGVVAREKTMYGKDGMPQTIHVFEKVAGIGDGVVPLLSAQRLPQFLAGGGRTETRIIVGKKPRIWKVLQEDAVEHSALMSHSKVWAMLDAFFYGDTVPPGDSLPSSENDAASMAATTSQVIFISGTSYVQITDGEGNTNTLLSAIAADRVPGVATVYGGKEPWVSIQADSSVALTITGTTSSSPLEVMICRQSSGGATSHLRRFRFDPSSHSWRAQLAALDTAPTTEPLISVDLNNNGAYEPAEARTPTQSSGGGAADTTAPTIALSLSVAGGQMVATLAGQDNSGSTAVRYTVNDGAVQNYQAPLAFSSAEGVVLKAFAEDASGNTSGLLTTSLLPLLKAQSAAGNTLVLEWPVADAYVLEEAFDLNGTWARSPATVSRTATRESASITAGGTARKFFRLRSNPVAK